MLFLIDFVLITVLLALCVFPIIMLAPYLDLIFRCYWTSVLLTWGFSSFVTNCLQGNLINDIKFMFYKLDIGFQIENYKYIIIYEKRQFRNEILGCYLLVITMYYVSNYLYLKTDRWCCFWEILQNGQSILACCCLLLSYIYKGTEGLHGHYGW